MQALILRGADPQRVLHVVNTSGLQHVPQPKNQWRFYIYGHVNCVL